MKRIVVLLATVLVSASAFADNYYRHEWINMGITSDMATSAVVSWRTDPSSANAVAQIAPATASPEIAMNARDVKAVSHIETVKDVCKCYHRASFTGLTPSTTYMYRVGDGGGSWSEWFEFTTAGDRNDSFSFVYFADVQSRIMDVYPRLVRKAEGCAPDAAFHVFTGDLTGSARESELNQFFSANSWMIAQRAVAPVPDNHDSFKNESGKKDVTPYWHNMFCFPQTGEKSLLYDNGEYTFDYDDCRFVMLNTLEIEEYPEEDYERFRAWLVSCLEDNPCHWAIVCQHQPVYNAIYGRSPSARKKDMQSIYESMGVDLVLSGHDHIYTRIARKDAAGRKSLPVYITSQAGGTVKEPAYHKYVDRMGSDMQLFQVIRVTPDEISYDSFDALGDKYDSFKLVRRKSGVKKFIESAPDREEVTTLPFRRKSKYDDAEWGRIDSLRREYNKARGIE